MFQETRRAPGGWLRYPRIGPERTERRDLAPGRVGWSGQGASTANTARAPLPSPPISLRGPCAQPNIRFLSFYCYTYPIRGSRVHCMVLYTSKPLPASLYVDVIRRPCLLLRTHSPRRECFAAVSALPYIQRSNGGPTCTFHLIGAVIGGHQARASTFMIVSGGW